MRCVGGALRRWLEGIKSELGGRGGAVFGRGGVPLLFVGSLVGLRGVWVHEYVRTVLGEVRGVKNYLGVTHGRGVSVVVILWSQKGTLEGSEETSRHWAG